MREVAGLVRHGNLWGHGWQRTGTSGTCTARGGPETAGAHQRRPLEPPAHVRVMALLWGKARGPGWEGARRRAAWAAPAWEVLGAPLELSVTPSSHPVHTLGRQHSALCTQPCSGHPPLALVATAPASSYNPAGVADLGSGRLGCRISGSGVGPQRSHVPLLVLTAEILRSPWTFGAVIWVFEKQLQAGAAAH